MKVEELMVEDLVWYDNQPYQIRQLGIFGENRDGEDYPAVCVGKPNGIGLILERDEIKPIPLTPEILEKNGFEYICDEYGCWLLGKIELREREPYNGLFEVEINIAKETTYIHYVHELQHLLKLCGIEKEIVL